MSGASKVQIVDGKPVLVNDFERTYVWTSIFPIVEVQNIILSGDKLICMRYSNQLSDCTYNVTWSS